MAYIELKSLSFRYPDGTQALKDVSLSIEKGSQVAVLGENGSGKSTLFGVLCGILNGFEGSCRIGEVEIRNKRDRKKLIGQVGMTFQNPDIQIFAPTVYQEVAFGPVNCKLERPVIEERTEEALRQTGLSGLGDRPVQYLSYGQKKRVTIADILAMETDIIILDEPFAWLDRKGREDMASILTGLRDKGKTLLISTHNPDFAWQWSEEVILFSRGSVCRAGAREEIFYDQTLLERAGVGQPAVVKMGEALGLREALPGTIEELAGQVAGRTVREEHTVV